MFTWFTPARPNDWQPIDLYNEKIDSKLSTFFLNKVSKLKLPYDWNNNLSKLWLYNLIILMTFVFKFKTKRDLHIHLLEQWIDQNPIGIGVMEPYPSSLRIQTL